MQMESPELPVGASGIHTIRSRKALSRDGKRPYDHIWELIGYLPRRKSVVDDLVGLYFVQIGLVHDCVHEESFRETYDAFWDRKWGDDDLTTVDLRWLALLFVMLAFARLLDSPVDATPESQNDCEETSVQFFWAARKAIVLAPTFSGESLDLVRAGILVSWYLKYFGRKTESWLTSSFAIRMAQAQGMHIDGKGWGLPPKALEIRRRLWCKLLHLDRSVSLAVGRPYTIHDKHCMQMDMRNIWLDDMSAEEALSAQEQPDTEPTRNMYYKHQQQLSVILGDIHDECFGLASAKTTSHRSYEKVMALDKMINEWAAALPDYFRLGSADHSLDAERPYLYWQRMYIHSAYHFARITLHRNFVLLESITDRFRYSREACISSACADLSLRLSLHNETMADRIRAGGAMHTLFNSALVLGIIVVREPFAPNSVPIAEDLAAYCEKQRADTWANEFVLAEVKVIELCIASLRKSRRDGRAPAAAAQQQQSTEQQQQPSLDDEERGQQFGWPASTVTDADIITPDIFSSMEQHQSHDNRFDNWFGLSAAFPAPTDFQFWEDLVGSLEQNVQGPAY